MKERGLSSTGRRRVGLRHPPSSGYCRCCFCCCCCCWAIVIFMLMLGDARAALPPVENFTVSIGAIYNSSFAESVQSSFEFDMLHGSYRTQLRLHPESIKTETIDSYSVSTAWCRLLAKGVFAVFGSHTVATINTVRSFSAAFRLPYLSIGLPVGASVRRMSRPPTMSSADVVGVADDELGYVVHVKPQFARAVVELLKHYECREMWYIYNSNEGLERLQQLLESLTLDGHAVRTNVYRVTDAGDAYRTIRQNDLRSRDGKTFLVDLSTKDTQRVLQMINNDTSGVHHRYILLDLGIHEMAVPAFANGGMNITGLQLVDFDSDFVKRYLANYSAFVHPRNVKMVPGSTLKKIAFESALAADAAAVLRDAFVRMSRHHPDIFRHVTHDGRTYNNGSEMTDCDADPVRPWRYGSEVMNYIRETTITGLTGSVQFDKFGLRRHYALDVLEVSLSRGLAKIGTWYSERGLEMLQRASLMRVTKGNATMSNKTRIITSILTQPYLMKIDEPTDDGKPRTGNDMYDGYCADLARKIADVIGFRYRIVPVRDEKYGAFDDKNGTWNGMVGELIRHEADLALAPLTITAARERVVDFSKPFMSLGISIMIKKPEKDVPGVVSFMKPLSYEIWMCVIFAYIGVSVVLFLVSRFSPLEWSVEDNTDGPAVTNNFTIFNSLWFSLGAFMQQGCDIEPRSMSGRIVGSVWWFFTLIIISSYTANLAAFLTVERMQSPIESADDLAKQTEIKYGTVDSGSTKDFFKSSTIQIYERMWAFMSSAEPWVFVKNNEEGVAQVRAKNGKYAFLAESTTVDYMNQRKPCDTMKVGSNLDSKGYGVATPLGSDLRDRITLAVLELLEGGELAKLETKWWLGKGECGKDGSPKKQESTSSLKLSNVAGIFYILLSGLLLALITAVLEFLYKSKLDASRRKTSFGNAVRSKAKLSMTGEPERQSSTYVYPPPTQLVSVDGSVDTDSHTQV